MKTTLVILAVLLSSSLAFAEVIRLKSGKTVEGKVIERTDKYLKINFNGVPLIYYLDEIESVDGKALVPIGAKRELPKPASQDKPESQEVELVLRRCLVKAQGNNCPGGAELVELSDVIVGNYDKPLDAWRVYAKSKIICHSDKDTIVKNPGNTMAALVRRTDIGELECFVPEKAELSLEDMGEAAEKVVTGLDTFFNRGNKK